MKDVKKATQCSVTIAGAGRINGVDFTAAGSGRGDTADGTWDFSVAFSQVPDRVHPFANLLGILILPTTIFGHETGSSRNLMSLAGGAIEFTQLARSERVHVHAAGRIGPGADGGLHWVSEATGELALPEVSAVETFDATMIPHGDGHVSDVFALPLATPDGRELVQVLRRVAFDPRARLAEVQYRRIEMTWDTGRNQVSVRTRSIIRTAEAPFPPLR